MSMKEQLERVREAYDRTAEAQRLWRTAELPDTPQFSALLAEIVRQAEDIDRRIRERRARFDAVPVLQALLRFKDGTTRRVAVSKPTDEIDEPHIGEMFHNALVKQGVVASCEAWPVLVVDRRGRIVAEIPPEGRYSLFWQ